MWGRLVIVMQCFLKEPLLAWAAWQLQWYSPTACGTFIICLQNLPHKLLPQAVSICCVLQHTTPFPFIDPRPRAEKEKKFINEEKGMISSFLDLIYCWVQPVGEVSSLCGFFKEEFPNSTEKSVHCMMLVTLPWVRNNYVEIPHPQSNADITLAYGQFTLNKTMDLMYKDG